MTARGLGLACAIGASGLGIAYLLLAGAPVHYLAIQAAAVGIGLVALIMLRRIGGRLPAKLSGPTIVVVATLLLATALLGPSIDGAARWMPFGAIYLQTSLILLPPMLLLFARSGGPAAASGVMLAAVALALQPDRAMTGVLAVSLATLALVRRDGWTLAAAATGAAAFVAALAQPDNLPAVPFVDQILYIAFDLHPGAGVAVVGGALMLILPAVGSGERHLRLVFGVMWLSMVAAAAIGNYPTPVVGYGGSAVLGYLLSVALLPGRARHSQGSVASRSAEHAPGADGGPLRMAAAAG